METFAELTALLRTAELSPAQRTLAERVLADPEGVAFQTAAELAGAVGVTEGTVVRFAQRCGLSGYPALVKLCRAHLSGQAQLVRRFDALDGDSVLERAAELDRQNLARTFAQVDPAAWRLAVASIARARRVHVMGLRKSHTVAYLLGYQLDLVCQDVTLVTPGPGTLTDKLRRLDPRDVFIAVSLRRYAADTVRAVRHAKAVGATTVAFTDTAASPLAGLADAVFLADMAGAGLLRSVTALTSLVQALATAVAVERGEAASTALRQQEALLTEFATYEP
ncbi:MurR/RpiR family transcriptional regulator [Crossiella cryophila]|uniref:DNA-binding MurR/RpiR family transcriptional regulator n=1 Tax=Crossiella cryophila TaxID=43355 RepID=A0A7W7FSC3_9PSEU|nr:MurR/RpiR family transcriptional regulator [Crossiella cryophila]MBB4675785.1 DNA-binding MurR/RpiR family transcriptional regulator [Crossiella cryophila]